MAGYHKKPKRGQATPRSFVRRAERDMAEAVAELERGERERHGGPFDQGRAEKVCNLVAIGMSFASIAQLPGMPSVRTLHEWRATNEQFLSMYRAAAESRAEYWAEEMLRISDLAMGAKQLIDPKTGRTVVDPGYVSACKMKAENIRWLLTKLYPLTYGEGLQLRHAGHDGGPLVLPRTFNIQLLSDEHLDQLEGIVTLQLAAPASTPADAAEADPAGEGGTEAA